MKPVLIFLLMAVSAMGISSEETSSNNQNLEMQLSSEIAFQEKVKIYDYDGNLMQEYLLKDVVNNDITIPEFFMLEDSDFAFDYLGDYYYFSEAKGELVVN